jgi:hypothetical protein
MAMISTARQTFKNIVYEFLWKGKKDPVKRSVLSNDYLEGGLKIVFCL